MNLLQVQKATTAMVLSPSTMEDTDHNVMKKRKKHFIRRNDASVIIPVCGVLPAIL